MVCDTKTGVASKTIGLCSSCASLICVYKSLDSVKHFPFFLPILTVLRANHEMLLVFQVACRAPKTMHKILVTEHFQLSAVLFYPMKLKKLYLSLFISFNFKKSSVLAIHTKIDSLALTCY